MSRNWLWKGFQICITATEARRFSWLVSFLWIFCMNLQIFHSVFVGLPFNKISEYCWHNFEQSLLFFSTVKLETIDVVCLEPGCMKHFTNAECLKAHVKSCHQHMTCETCGSKQLKKNMKRHLRTHEASSPSKVFQCEFEGCDCTFSTVRCLRSLNGMIYMLHEFQIIGYIF